MGDPTYTTPENPGFIGGIFWRGILLTFVCRILALQLITTYVAMAALREHIVIPDGHFLLFGIPLYLPWSIFHWYVEYSRVIFTLTKAPFHSALVISIPILVMSMLFMGSVSQIAYRSRIKRYAAHQDQLYGSNRWATIEDLEAARLLDGQGILLGAFESDN